MDAIVHLGGYAVEGPWEGILSANIVGCYNVFEAARRNGVKRSLFPTSNHATGFYRRELLPVSERVPGPAIILQMDSTTVVPPHYTFEADAAGNLIVRKADV